MRLFQYTYKRLSWVMLVLLIIWGLVFYSTITREVMDETDDTLDNYKRILISMMLKDSTLLQSDGDFMMRYKIKEISSDDASKYKQRYYDDLLYIECEDEYEPIRVLTTSFLASNNRYYELKIMLSTLERDDMIRAILIHILALYLLFFIITGISTRVILKKSFKPIYQLLDWINKIQPSQKATPYHYNTQIEEINMLERAAVQMNNRSYNAFIQQKEFVENASHELQTPLAIVSAKLELLSDSDNLNENQYQIIEDIMLTINRAVNLNKSLLLLSKIQNNQFPNQESVNINILIDNILKDFQEIYEYKNINIDFQKHDSFIITANESLVRIMLLNLLKNAFIHSPEGGTIIIEIQNNSFVLQNIGTVPLDGDKVFSRFYKSANQSSNSTGLGLSIAYTIAEKSNLKLKYEWRNEKHVFLLSCKE